MVFKRTTSVLGALALAASAAVTLQAGAASAAPADVTARAPVAFSGQAWGSRVKVAEDVLNSGKTAFVTVGCTQMTDVNHSNDSVAVNIPGVGDIGAVTTSAITSTDGAGAYSVTTRSNVAASTLLPGGIAVGAITTLARASFDGTNYQASTEFTIASLSIGGVDVTLTGGEQVIPILGVGTLTIGKSSTQENPNSSSASVTALRLELDSGTVIRIGHSQASIDSAVNAIFDGGAYGTKVQVLDTVTSGRTAWQPMPCPGTRGKDRTNEVATADLGGLGTAQNVVSTVNAQQRPLPEAHASNEIASASLTGGLLQLEGISAFANVYEDADGVITTDTGATGLVSITLAGVSVTVPPPGGSVELTGVGTLYFFEETSIKNGQGVEVIAVRLVLTDGETEIILGRAAAAIK